MKKDYKYTINGQQFEVAIGDIDENTATVIVNGEEYKVEMEPEPEMVMNYEDEPEIQQPQQPIAPISFTQHADPVFSGSVPTGVTLLFPNGLRAHFGSGTEDVLRDLLDKSLMSHVLPE